MVELWQEEVLLGGGQWGTQYLMTITRGVVKKPMELIGLGLKAKRVGSTLGPFHFAVEVVEKAWETL